VFSLFKQAIEKAGSTDPDKLRAAMEDASWPTPQGTKTMRKGDHQAVVDMIVVKVKGNDFQTVGKVQGGEAVGPDTCDKF
jgi:branched-chain amino acid transport system substrate-binding protein